MYSCRQKVMLIVKVVLMLQEFCIVSTMYLHCGIWDGSSSLFFEYERHPKVHA